MGEKPLVSIIIPSYNMAHFLPETLDSVIAQKYSNFEALIIDDGSTDQTREVAQKYQKKDSRIKYVYQENKGLGGARNTGINNATGELISTLDADDQYHPDFLSKTVDRLLSSNKKTVAVAPNGNFYLKGKKLARSFYQTFQTPEKITLRNELEGNKIPSVGLMKKAIIKEVGLYRKIRQLEDYDLWLRLLLTGYQIATEPEPLFRYRLHGQSLSANRKKMAGSEVELFQQLLKGKLGLSLRPSLRGLVKKRLADSYCAKEDYQEAIKIHRSFKTGGCYYLSRISPALVRSIVNLKRILSSNPRERIN